MFPSFCYIWQKGRGLEIGIRNTQREHSTPLVVVRKVEKKWTRIKTFQNGEGRQERRQKRRQEGRLA
jgi:hypothetical protein